MNMTMPCRQREAAAAKKEEDRLAAAAARKDRLDRLLNTPSGPLKDGATSLGGASLASAQQRLDSLPCSLRPTQEEVLAGLLPAGSGLLDGLVSPPGQGAQGQGQGHTQGGEEQQQGSEGRPAAGPLRALAGVLMQGQGLNGFAAALDAISPEAEGGAGAGAGPVRLEMGTPTRSGSSGALKDLAGTQQPQQQLTQQGSGLLRQSSSNGPGAEGPRRTGSTSGLQGSLREGLDDANERFARLAQRVTGGTAAAGAAAGAGGGGAGAAVGLAPAGPAAHHVGLSAEEERLVQEIEGHGLGSAGGEAGSARGLQAGASSLGGASGQWTDAQIAAEVRELTRWLVDQCMIYDMELGWDSD